MAILIVLGATLDYFLPAFVVLAGLADLPVTDVECAFFAGAIWPALAITREGAAWGATELAEVDSWFEALEPVLPEEPASGVRAVARP